MLTNKDYCDYDTCVALKELGFVPTHSTSWSIEEKLIVHLYDAQKWLREEKSVIIVVCPYSFNLLHEIHTWTYEIWLGDNLESQANNFDSYEETLSEGIKGAVKILKEK